MLLDDSEILDSVNETLAAANVGQNSEFEMDVGCDIISVTLNENFEIVLYGHRKYGDGQEPYASSPEQHIDDLNHPSCDSGEGVVKYVGLPNRESLELPKHLYFEERYQLEPQDSVEGLEEEISDFLDLDIEIANNS